MTAFLKNIILIITVLTLIVGFTVYAQDVISIDLPDDFYVHSKEPQKVAEILRLTESDLSDYCMNNSILYLAVNKDNTKQIRVTIGENEFSNGVINLSNLSEDKIESLSADIAGIEKIKGEAVDLLGQKFLKTELQSSDSGGEYILTQYITVAERQNIVLSFYTSGSHDTNYTEEVFFTLSSPMFIREESEAINAFSVVIPIATVAFVIICIGLGISIVIDLKKQKDSTEEEFEETEDNTDE